MSEGKPRSLKRKRFSIHELFQITPGSSLAETLQENQLPLADGKVDT